VKSATANFKQMNFPKPKEVLSHGLLWTFCP